MANNRLYILDSKTGEHFCLVRSMGDGWYVREGAPEFVASLEEWLDGRDIDAAYGSKPTVLKLATEDDLARLLPAYNKLLQKDTG